MTMQIVNLVQGSPEWHAHRAQHFNASDAPAMMGCSAYRKRSELVKELATGIVPEIDAATQRRFDDGHKFEALARPLAEEIIGEELSPCVGTRGKYSASFDGLTFMSDTGFEHKSLNDRLRAAFDDIESVAPEYRDEQAGKLLPPEYAVQMEQQAMVSGAERILFMASKWRLNQDTGEYELVEERHCWYTPNLQLRAQIVAGWEQLEKDVAAYAPEAASPEVIGQAPETLPALRIEVQGAVTASNLEAFKVTALSAIRSVNTELKTDQDFADADKAVKWCEEVESRLAAAKEHALGQTESIGNLFRTIDEISEEARQVRLKLSKLVKSEKEKRKEQIVLDAQKDLDEHVAALNQRLGANWLPRIAGGFAETVKGLKSLDSMRDKVAVALTSAKLQAETTANTLLLNRDFLRGDGTGQDWITLFPDFPAMGVKEPEVFKAMATMRISDFKQAEADRLEAERARIRAEEEAKARREAEARSQAEAAEQARQLEADRARIRAEEQAKAQAEAAQRRQQVQQQDQAAQVEIARAAQDGALAKPLADDLSGLVAEQAAEGVAGIDAQQAISTAKASAAVAPAATPAADEPTMTLGQINTRMEAMGLGKISAATLEFHGIPFAKERAAVQIKATQARRLMLLISMGARKLADEVQTTTV